MLRYSGSSMNYFSLTSVFPVSPGNARMKTYCIVGERDAL